VMARLYTAATCKHCDGIGKIYTPRKGFLKKLREAAGVTQKDAAAMAGFTASYLCDVENGHRRWTRPLQLLYMKLEAMAEDVQRKEAR